MKLSIHKQGEKNYSRQLLVHSEEEKQIGEFNVTSAYNICGLVSEKPLKNY